MYTYYLKAKMTFKQNNNEIWKHNSVNFWVLKDVKVHWVGKICDNICGISFSVCMSLTITPHQDEYIFLLYSECISKNIGYYPMDNSSIYSISSYEIVLCCHAHWHTKATCHLSTFNYRLYWNELLLNNYRIGNWWQPGSNSKFT